MLAAFREIHDGRWERNVGVDGGKSLLWEGRLVVIARRHDGVGPRPRCHRVDGRPVRGRAHGFDGGPDDGRTPRLPEHGHRDRRCGRNSPPRRPGCWPRCRPPTAIDLTEAEQERLLDAANVVTLARTGVEYDYRGDVIDAHAPEMPTRFAKQLMQLVRGAVAHRPRPGSGAPVGDSLRPRLDAAAPARHPR